MSDNIKSVRCILLNYGPVERLKPTWQSLTFSFFWGGGGHYDKSCFNAQYLIDLIVQWNIANINPSQCWRKYCTTLTSLVLKLLLEHKFVSINRIIYQYLKQRTKTCQGRKMSHVTVIKLYIYIIRLSWPIFNYFHSAASNNQFQSGSICSNNSENSDKFGDQSDAFTVFV